MKKSNIRSLSPHAKTAESRPRITTAAGFTLIELMIVVAIVGILAFIAYPSYQDSARKAKRSDGKAALQQIAARQETYFQNNKTYTATLSDLNMSTTSTEGYYSLSVVAATAACPITTCYALQAAATSKGAQNKDTSCTPLTLNSLGVKGPATCW